MRNLLISNIDVINFQKKLSVSFLQLSTKEYTFQYLTSF
jgi:hypothetical protein